MAHTTTATRDARRTCDQNAPARCLDGKQWHAVRGPSHTYERGTVSDFQVTKNRPAYFNQRPLRPSSEQDCDGGRPIHLQSNPHFRQLQPRPREVGRHRRYPLSGADRAPRRRNSGSVWWPRPSRLELYHELRVHHCELPAR